MWASMEADSSTSEGCRAPISSGGEALWRPSRPWAASRPTSTLVGQSSLTVGRPLHGGRLRNASSTVPFCEQRQVPCWGLSATHAAPGSASKACLWSESQPKKIISYCQNS